MRAHPNRRLDRSWNDFCLLVSLNTTPPTYVAQRLPHFWSGLHLYYHEIEECAADYIVCWDGTHAMRLAPLCAFEGCPDDPRLCARSLCARALMHRADTGFWLMVAFSLGIVCLVLCVILGCVVRSAIDERRSRRRFVKHTDTVMDEMNFD